MNATFLKILVACFLLWSSTHPIRAQDPFFIHFYNNGSEFNPALVGIKGATSFNAKYKSQWPGSNVQTFKSSLFSFEETIPCSLFDYGFALKFDEEGDGYFRTYDLGFKFAGTPAFETGNHTLHNIRIGGRLGWAYKTIDYSKFTFSDQIDPKYGFYDSAGNTLTTAFTPPNSGRSHIYFTPSVGLVYNGLFDQHSNRPVNLQIGAAVHNAYSIGGNAYGNEESILQLGTKIPVRYTAFVRVEWVPYYRNRNFLILTPSLLHQRQAGLNYTEAGLQFALNRLLSTGIYYHFNQRPEAGNNTNWFTFNIELGEIIKTKGTQNRLDLGFAYAANFSGLKNTVGPILELSISYHFAASPMCSLMNRESEVPYGRGDSCHSFSKKRKKIFENNWSKITKIR